MKRNLLIIIATAVLLTFLTGCISLPLSDGPNAPVPVDEELLNKAAEVLIGEGVGEGAIESENENTGNGIHEEFLGNDPNAWTEIPVEGEETGEGSGITPEMLEELSKLIPGDNVDLNTLIPESYETANPNVTAAEWTTADESWQNVNPNLETADLAAIAAGIVPMPASAVEVVGVPVDDIAIDDEEGIAEEETVQTISSVEESEPLDMLSEYEKFVAEMGGDVKMAASVSTPDYDKEADVPEEEPVAEEPVEQGKETSGSSYDGLSASYTVNTEPVPEDRSWQDVPEDGEIAEADVPAIEDMTEIVEPVAEETEEMLEADTGTGEMTSEIEEVEEEKGPGIFAGIWQGFRNIFSMIGGVFVGIKDAFMGLFK